ncbi:MAG: hypothetical protein K2Y28_05995 [Burkholderiaceae bacterium]|nr:hypothetical protein [Burkholderiaceae bacterium]
MAIPIPTSFTMPDGTVYNLDHMQRMNSAVLVTVNGKRYRIPIVVMFSTHCYTDGKDNTVEMTDDLYFHTDDTGHRAFSKERYNTSLKLPDYVRSMIEKSEPCYKLNKANNYVHLPDPGKPDKWRGWYVFFTFDRSKEGGVVALRVSITSYHYRMKKPENLRWMGSIKFPALVAEWLSKRDDVLQQFLEIVDVNGTLKQP